MKNHVSLAAVAAVLLGVVAFVPTSAHADGSNLGGLGGCRISSNVTTCRQTPDTTFGTGSVSGAGNATGAAALALGVAATGLGIVVAKRFFRS